MINRRAFMKTAGLAAAAIAARTRAASTNLKRPNILLILADDMGFSDPGCYGGEIDTPNLDRLAKNGIRFTQIGNTSKCFPSRACLLTGVYAQQCGMDRRCGAFRNFASFGDVLGAAGYTTLWSGKHHSTTNPCDMGFDRYYGLRDGCCNYFNPGNRREGEGRPARKRVRTWRIDGKTFKPYTPKEKDFYTTDYFTKYAIKFLDQCPAGKPFLLYLAYTAPHDPLMAWPADIKKYKGRYDAGWKAVRDARFKRQREMGMFGDEVKLSRPDFGDWDRLSGQKKADEIRKMEVYAAMVDRMDQNIGKVLAKIKEMGRLENTLVLFASDNGGSAEVVRLKNSSGEIGTMTRWTSVCRNWANVSNTPFRKYKNYSHEGGICTPLIAHWPSGIKNPGRFVRSPGHFIDFMATFIDITGAEYPKQLRGQKVAPLQGVSFLPALRDETAPPRGPIFWQWGRGRAVRKGKWKLVSLKKKWELYDMDTDRTETTDLASSHPDKVRELSALWKKWREGCKKI